MQREERSDQSGLSPGLIKQPPQCALSMLGKLKVTAKSMIRFGRYPGRSESSMGANVP